jgi:hypothetical protein
MCQQSEVLMKVDWEKEIAFQVAQCKGLFHGIGRDIRMTLALMCIVMPPVFAMLLIFDLMFKMW